VLTLGLNALFLLAVGAHAGRVRRGAHLVLSTAHVGAVSSEAPALRTAVQALTCGYGDGEVVAVLAVGVHFESAKLGASLHTL